LVEWRLALLEARDDLLELGLRPFERLLLGAHPASSSTTAPKDPSATRTSTCVPARTSEADVTTCVSVRTIAYPRSSVFSGDNTRSLPADDSRAARFRSTASVGARWRRSCRRSSPSRC